MTHRHYSVNDVLGILADESIPMKRATIYLWSAELKIERCARADEYGVAITERGLSQAKALAWERHHRAKLRDIIAQKRGIAHMSADRAIIRQMQKGKTLKSLWDEGYC